MDSSKITGANSNKMSKNYNVSNSLFLKITGAMHPSTHG